MAFKGPKKRVAWLGLAAVVLAIPSFTWRLGTSQAEGPAGTDGVLVLRNGQVLHGHVTRLDNRFGIRQSEGSELRIAASDVDFAAASLEEACQRKAARNRPGSVDDQIQFAEWCLRQGQISRAAQATAEALRLAPDDPRVASLERRLTALLQPPTPIAPTETASANQRSTTHVDALARQLSPAATQKFTTHIQPLLLNRCAAAGCHGIQATSAYELQRPPLGHSPNRRLTQYNLLATLSRIDLTAPDTSPLLEKSKEIHGKSGSRASTEVEQGQYEQLLDWVRLASRPAAAIRPATIHDGAPSLQQTSPVRPVPLPTEASAELAAPNATAPSNLSSDASSGSREKRPKSILSARAGGVSTKSSDSPPASSSAPPTDSPDPFDPALFNRRRP